MSLNWFKNDLILILKDNQIDLKLLGKVLAPESAVQEVSEHLMNILKGIIKSI